MPVLARSNKPWIIKRPESVNRPVGAADFSWPRKRQCNAKSGPILTDPDPSCQKQWRACNQSQKVRAGRFSHILLVKEKPHMRSLTRSLQAGQQHTNPNPLLRKLGEREQGSSHPRSMLYKATQRPSASNPLHNAFHSSNPACNACKRIRMQCRRGDGWNPRDRMSFNVFHFFTS